MDIYMTHTHTHKLKTSDSQIWYRLCQMLPGNLGSGFISVAVIKNCDRGCTAEEGIYLP